VTDQASAPAPAYPGDRDRDRIFAAMIDLSVGCGYANVTLPMLLERAGVGEREFCSRFDDLEDCFCQIMEVETERAGQQVLTAFAAEQGWQAQLRAAAQALLDYLLEDLTRARFVCVEVMYAGDRAKLLRDRQMQAFFLLIDQGRQEMVDPEALTPFTAEAIGSSIYQRMQNALVNEQLEEFETSIPEMMYLAVLPYLGEEAAEEELDLPPTPLPAR
jgi:AcrR family transcriptional regulator